MYLPYINHISTNNAFLGFPKFHHVDRINRAAREFSPQKTKNSKLLVVGSIPHQSLGQRSERVEFYITI